MVKCVFCGKDSSSFKGVHLLRNDGTTSYYCTSKCKRNALNLKRDKRKVRWAEAFHERRAKAKEKSAEKVKIEKEEKAEKKVKKKEKEKKPKKVKKGQ